MINDALKIMAISLTSTKKYKMLALYNGEQLIITHANLISGIFGSWRDSLVKEIEDAKAKGFIVIVEEKTDYIARHGVQYLLEDQNDENRSNYFDALDWYFALSDMDNIVFSAEVQQFAIRSGGEGQRVEKKQDDKGRPIYEVDWSRFHGGFRAVLLCVVAALYEPLSERFLAEMYQELPDAEEHPVNRWQKLFKDRGAALEADLMKARGAK